MDIFLTILGVVLGGGILAFIQFLITRHDSKHDKLTGVKESINALSEKVDERFDTLDRKIDMVNAKGDERFAVSSRVRILRFEDELQEKRKHSKDSWDQAMADIDYYEAYCQAHPKFKNNQTAATVEHIKHGYGERLEKHDWSY